MAFIRLNLVLILLLSSVFAEITPYLQTATHESVIINWERNIAESAEVLYGKTKSLGSRVTAVSEPLSTDCFWNMVKLERLVPNTVYYYQVKTDSDESEVLRFQTFPEPGYEEGNIRFLVFGDNRTDYEKATEIVAAAKGKLIELYGADFDQYINFSFNVGDILTNGNELSQYQTEYFEPIAELSPYIPFMVSIGNHERESSYYYQYMKYEEFAGPEGESYYAFQVGRILVIALNSNSEWRNDAQIQWLQETVDAAESDDTIDWVFSFCHHPPLSSVWSPGNTAYVSDRIMPVLAESPKASFLINGHSHCYERGAHTDDPLRIMLIGGGGGPLDRWSENVYVNYPEHHRAFDHYHWTLFDVDIKNGLCTVQTFSQGHPDKPLHNVKIDSFTHKLYPSVPPAEPVGKELPDSLILPVTLSASPYNGAEAILSSQIQIADATNHFDDPIRDIIRDFEDYFLDIGTPDWTPIDQNAGIVLNEYTLTQSDLPFPGSYYWRIRYRDQQLQWSPWSDSLLINIVETGFAFPVTINNALEFNGQSGYLEITDSLDDAEVPAQKMTVETWVKLESNHNWGGYIGAFQDNGGYEKGWVLGNYQNTFSFALSTLGTDDGDGKMTYMATDQAFDYQKWYHVAATYDGQTMRLYVNGIMVKTDNSQQGDILYDNDSYFNIGVYHDDNEEFVLDGQLDEVRLWKTALTQNEIQDWMHKEVNENHPKFSDLISSWSFNKISMSEAEDLTNNNPAQHVNLSPLQMISSSAPVGIYGDLLKGETTAGVGEDGTHLLLEAKTATSNQNYLGLYQIGHKDSAIVTNDRFEQDIFVRQPLYWGVFEFGDMQADLYFYYAGFRTLPTADSLKLFKRYDVNEAWEDISAEAIHNPEEAYFILSEQSEFGEYTLGWNKNAVTEIELNTVIPNKHVLLKNYPNPFNPETIIDFTLPSAGKISIDIYDISGRHIRRLIGNKTYIAGNHKIRWDSTDNRNRRLSSGIYFCRLYTDKVSVYIKLTLLK